MKNAMTLLGKTPRSGHFGLPVLALVIYGLACVSPAIYLEPWRSSQGSSWLGLVMLLFGWMGPVYLQFAWYANPLLFVTWVLMITQRRKAALILAIIAFCFALNTPTFLSAKIPAGSFGEGSVAVTGFGIGAYLWFGSIVITVIGAFVGFWSKRKTKKP